MKNSISHKIYNHLEFLGYKVEDVETKNDIDMIIGKSEEKSNLILMILKGIIYITAQYIIGKEKDVDTKKLLIELNKVNSDSIITKWFYVKGDKGLVIKICTSSFGYEKERFSKLLDRLEKEVTLAMPQFSKFVK